VLGPCRRAQKSSTSRRQQRNSWELAWRTWFAAHAPLRQSAPRPPPNRQLVEKIDALVFDCDGVIYRHLSAVPGVPETLAKLRAAGKRLLFVTNTPPPPRERASPANWPSSVWLA
jgi:hypothetical protein